MRFFGFKLKHRAADASTLAPASTIEPPLLSPEDAALQNYNEMHSKALTRERRAINQH